MKTMLLCSCLLAAGTVALAAESGAGVRDRLGIQMWSLRETSKTDTLAALDLVQKYGLKEIETAGLGTLTLDQYVAAVKQRDLVVVGTHAGYEALQSDLAGTIKTAQALGAHYIVCPWIPHDKAGFTVEQAHKVAADFNAWGKTIRAAGLQLGWHPHGFEFVKSSTGETPFDVIVRETSPDNLVLEMDVFWVVHAGQDPVALLKKHGTRWQLMHVKDIRKGAPTGFSTGGAPVTDNVAVGEGAIDWNGVFATAQQLGMKHYLIEDETAEPLQNIPASVKYLRAVEL